MKDSSASIATINEYIADFPEDIQKKLQEMRATIKAAAPAAQEKISYQMPTFPINEPLPLDLVTKIVKFRVEENLKIAESKASKKKKS